MAWTRVVKQGSLPIIAEANSYVDEADFDAYCEQMGVDLSKYDDDAQQTATLNAAQYINSLQFTGSTYEFGAIMQFPRSGMADVPQVVVGAQLWLAVKLLTTPDTPLYDDTANGKLKRKTVGPISKEWFSPEDLGQRGIHFDYVDNMLRGLLAVTNKIWIEQVK